MKLFLVLALLSVSCLYGMEDNSKNPLKKSQELPKIFFYYDSPCGNPIIMCESEFYKPPTKISLTSSLTFVPSQLLIGAMVMSKEIKNKETNNNE